MFEGKEDFRIFFVVFLVFPHKHRDIERLLIVYGIWRIGARPILGRSRVFKVFNNGFRKKISE